MNHLHLHMALELNQQLRNSMSGNFLWAHPLTLAVFFSTFHQRIIAICAVPWVFLHYMAIHVKYNITEQQQHLLAELLNSRFLPLSQPTCLHQTLWYSFISSSTVSVRHHMATTILFLATRNRPQKKSGRTTTSVSPEISWRQQNVPVPGTVRHFPLHQPPGRQTNLMCPRTFNEETIVSSCGPGL